MQGWQIKEEGAVFVGAYILVALILNYTIKPPLSFNRLLGVSLAISLAVTAIEVLGDMYIHKK